MRLNAYICGRIYLTGLSGPMKQVMETNSRKEGGLVGYLEAQPLSSTRAAFAKQLQFWSKGNLKSATLASLL